MSRPISGISFNSLLGCECLLDRSSGHRDSHSKTW